MQNETAVFPSILLTVLLLTSDFFKKAKLALSKDEDIDYVMLCTKVIFWQRRDREKVRFSVPFRKEAVWYQPANIIPARLFHLSVNTTHCLLNSLLWLHDCWQTEVWNKVGKNFWRGWKRKARALEWKWTENSTAAPTVVYTEQGGEKNLEDIVFVFSYSSDRNFRRKPKHLKAFGEDDE